MAVLVLLNTYPVWLLQRSVFTGKHTSLSGQASFLAGELSLDGINPERVGWIMEILYEKVPEADRVTVCAADGLVVYDSAPISRQTGRYFVSQDVLAALSGQDIFRSAFQNEVFVSQMTVPIIVYGKVTGVLHISQYDSEQGKILLDLHTNLLMASFVIFLIALMLGLMISVMLTQRFTEFLKTIGIFSAGNYDYSMPVRGKGEMAEMAGKLNHLAEILKQTESSRQQFVADASHELKTPLASMKLLADSILQTPDMPQELIREFISDIGDETDRLSHMTETLLRLSKAEALGRQNTVIELAVVIRRAVRMLLPLAAGAEVELRCVLDDGCRIMGNEDDLYQIVFNLLDNAVKYNNSGGQVIVSCSGQDDKVCITVKDSGAGIPQKDLPSIFERFYRVDKARSRETGGTGLGLSIVAHITERMNGEISVESEFGAGSEFTVFFPSASP